MKVRFPLTELIFHFILHGVFDGQSVILYNPLNLADYRCNWRLCHDENWHVCHAVLGNFKPVDSRLYMCVCLFAWGIYCVHMCGIIGNKVV